MNLYLKTSTADQPGLFDQTSVPAVDASLAETPAPENSPPLNESSPIIMLSLWQPWASFCVWKNPADGDAEKQVETRHWAIEQRGLVAIHATKVLKPEAKFMIETEPLFRETLVNHVGDYGDDWRELERRLTFGAVVGVAEFYAVADFETDAAAVAWANAHYPPREKFFGNYRGGRFGWRFRRPIEFSEPIPARGFQKFGAPCSEVREQIFSRLREAGYFDQVNDVRQKSLTDDCCRDEES